VDARYQRSRSAPIGLFLLLPVAGVLYVLLLQNAWRPFQGGEAGIGDAFEGFFLVSGLWITLIVMMLVAVDSGAMPRWCSILAAILVPLSGVAAFVAVDMCSRNMRWAILFPGLLAPLIAFYAIWTRSPWLLARLPAQSTSLAAWGAILLLSIAPLLLANWL
jgi:hypothetical protein